MENLRDSKIDKNVSINRDQQNCKLRINTHTQINDIPPLLQQQQAGHFNFRKIFESIILEKDSMYTETKKKIR